MQIILQRESTVIVVVVIIKCSAVQCIDVFVAHTDSLSRLEEVKLGGSVIGCFFVLEIMIRECFLCPEYAGGSMCSFAMPSRGTDPLLMSPLSIVEQWVVVVVVAGSHTLLIKHKELAK